MMDTLQIKKLLVPVDGSECSRFAAEQAVRIAAVFGAEIVFLYAVDHHVVDAFAQHDSEEARNHLLDRLFENGRMYVRDMARTAEAAGVPCREEIREGDPCMVICEAAQEYDVDCIIIGKTGRRGARRLVTGSVTRRVTECADCPVLIVNDPRFCPAA